RSSPLISASMSARSSAAPVASVMSMRAARRRGFVAGMQVTGILNHARPRKHEPQVAIGGGRGEFTRDGVEMIEHGGPAGVPRPAGGGELIADGIRERAFGEDGGL